MQMEGIVDSKDLEDLETQRPEREVWSGKKEIPSADIDYYMYSAKYIGGSTGMAMNRSIKGHHQRRSRRLTLKEPVKTPQAATGSQAVDALKGLAENTRSMCAQKDDERPGWIAYCRAPTVEHLL